MMEIKGFNGSYQCGFSVKSSNINICENIPFEYRMCFSKLFYCITGNKVPLLDIDLNIHYGPQKGPGNRCLIDYDELIIWLDYLKTLINYEYTIFNDTTSLIYRLNLKYEGNKFKLKFLLTLIRFSFECDFAAALKETFLLRKYGYYNELSLYYLYHLVQSLLPFYPSGHGTLDRGYLQLLSDEKLKEKIDSYKDTSINSFNPWRKEDNEEKQSLNNLFLMENFDKLFIDSKNFRFKDTKEEVEERLKYYNHNIIPLYGTEEN